MQIDAKRCTDTLTGIARERAACQQELLKLQYHLAKLDGLTTVWAQLLDEATEPDTTAAPPPEPGTRAHDARTYAEFASRLKAQPHADR